MYSPPPVMVPMVPAMYYRHRVERRHVTRTHGDHIQKMILNIICPSEFPWQMVYVCAKNKFRLIFSGKFLSRYTIDPTGYGGDMVGRKTKHVQLNLLWIISNYDHIEGWAKPMWRERFSYFDHNVISLRWIHSMKRLLMLQKSGDHQLRER